MSKEDFIRLCKIIYELNQFGDDICKLFDTYELPMDKPMTDLYEYILEKLGYTVPMLYDFNPCIDEVIYEVCNDEVIGEYYDKALEEIKNYIPSK